MYIVLAFFIDVKLYLLLIVLSFFLANVSKLYNKFTKQMLLIQA